MPAVVSRTVGSLYGIRLDDGWTWLDRARQKATKSPRMSSDERPRMPPDDANASGSEVEHGQLAGVAGRARPVQAGASMAGGANRHVRQAVALQDAANGVQRVLRAIVLLAQVGQPHGTRTSIAARCDRFRGGGIGKVAVGAGDSAFQKVGVRAVFEQVRVVVGLEDR